jgi:raffinose/stachyose/melibiose transport system permease protein
MKLDSTKLPSTRPRVTKLQTANPRISRQSPVVLQTIILAVFIVFSLVPVYLGIVASLRNERDLFASPLSIPWPLNLQNYATVWIEGQFNVYFLNSLKISLITTAIVLIVSPLAAFAFAKLRFPAREALFAMFLVGLVIPVPAIIVALYGNLARLNLLDTHAGVILPQAAIFLPFAIFMLRTFFQEVPSELLEAAYIDGATTLRTFWNVALPLTAPALRSLGLIVFMFAWQEYLLPLVVLQNDVLKPLTVGMTTFQGRYGVNYAGIATAGVITFLPIVALFLFLQRSFTQGLAAGALK